MSFQKLKTSSHIVGGRHRSATTNDFGVITSIGSKVLVGHCSIGKEKIFMTVSDNKIATQGLGDSFKFLGKKGLYHQKEWLKTL